MIMILFHTYWAYGIIFTCLYFTAYYAFWIHFSCSSIEISAPKRNIVRPRCLRRQRQSSLNPLPLLPYRRLPRGHHQGDPTHPSLPHHSNSSLRISTSNNRSNRRLPTLYKSHPIPGTVHWTEITPYSRYCTLNRNHTIFQVLRTEQTEK